MESKHGRTGPIKSVIHMELTSVTADFIPVESSYERIMADLLVAQGRPFTKPMRCDASMDKVLPVLILMDTAKKLPIEVFGRDDPTT